MKKFHFRIKTKAERQHRRRYKRGLADFLEEVYHTSDNNTIAIISIGFLILVYLLLSALDRIFECFCPCYKDMLSELTDDQIQELKDLQRFCTEEEIAGYYKMFKAASLTHSQIVALLGKICIFSRNDFGKLIFQHNRFRSPGHLLKFCKRYEFDYVGERRFENFEIRTKSNLVLIFKIYCLPGCSETDEEMEVIKNTHMSALFKCRNCNYYHGKAYNGNYLHCAIHPGGKDIASCRDFSSTD